MEHHGEHAETPAFDSGLQKIWEKEKRLSGELEKARAEAEEIIKAAQKDGQEMIDRAEQELEAARRELFGGKKENKPQVEEKSLSEEQKQEIRQGIAANMDKAVEFLVTATLPGN